MIYDRNETFREGRHTKEGTKARVAETNFLANHRADDQVHANEDKGELGLAEASQHLDLADPFKKLTAVLLTKAQEYASKAAERLTRTTSDVLDLPMLVDSGALRDALPVRFFLGSSAPLGETALSSYNGGTKALVYAHPAMPRLGPG